MSLVASYASGYSVRYNSAYQEWDAIGRDRQAFQGWLKRLVSNERTKVTP